MNHHKMLNDLMFFMLGFLGGSLTMYTLVDWLLKRGAEVKCQDCGIEIHPESTHTGHEKWCEDCFDKGLCRDMNDHWNNYWANEMRGNEAEE